MDTHYGATVNRSSEEIAFAGALNVARASQGLRDKCSRARFERELPAVLAEVDRLWNALACLQQSLSDGELRNRLKNTHVEAVSYAGEVAPSYVEAIFRAGERQYATVNMLCRHGVLFDYLSRLHPSPSGNLSEPWPQLPKVEEIDFTAKGRGSYGGNPQKLLAAICREIEALPAVDLTVDCEQARAFLEREVAAVMESLTIARARAKFCFEQRQSGQTYKEINASLRRHPEWEAFENDPSVRSAIESWAKQIGQTPRKGQSGRRPKV